LLLRWSFLLGLLYGLVNTVPVAVLKHDLSCNCAKDIIRCPFYQASACSCPSGSFTWLLA
jgi:hypothetical protein